MRISDTSRDKDNVYFEGFKVVALSFNPTVQVKRSVEKVPLVSLFNDFGSSMGLWLGISVFSSFEMAKEFALGMEVGGKWESLPKVMVVLFSLFPIGVGCIFIFFNL